MAEASGNSGPMAISTGDEPGNPPHVRNDLFDKKIGLVRGASKGKETLWFLVKVAFFVSPLPWPPRLRAALLRAFGAKVGVKLHTKPRVNIHFPWKLTIGDHCWIGESCELLNLEHLTLEDHVALGHEVYIACGSHDIGSRTMAYQNRPVSVGKGTWIATRAFVGAGVTIGRNCVIGAGSIVVRDIPDDAIAVGNPARQVGTRRLVRD